MALPPLELFSLERRGRLLPGGLFVWLLNTKATENTKVVSRRSQSVWLMRISSTSSGCDSGFVCRISVRRQFRLSLTLSEHFLRRGPEPKCIGLYRSTFVSFVPFVFTTGFRLHPNVISARVFKSGTSRSGFAGDRTVAPLPLLPPRRFTHTE
jgi:hypothetical protein